MKNKQLLSKILIVLLTAVLFLSANCQAAQAATPDDLPDCPICDVPDGYDGPLTDTEIYGLLLALNDEYHAVEVYQQVLDDFGQVRPFSRIQLAEERHITALLNLFDLYDVPVPDNPWPGSVAQFESVQAACEAAVEAEVVNRDLYALLYDTTERVDIEQVYQALQNASEDNHLPAFERCASDSSGNPGNGNGNGNGGRGGGNRGSGNGRICNR